MAAAPDEGVLRMVQRVHDTDGVSKVQVELAYELPGGVLEDITRKLDLWVVDEAFAGCRNEQELEGSLRNLKELVESGTSRSGRSRSVE